MAKKNPLFTSDPQPPAGVPVARHYPALRSQEDAEGPYVLYWPEEGQVRYFDPRYKRVIDRCGSLPLDRAWKQTRALKQLWDASRGDLRYPLDRRRAYRFLEDMENVLKTAQQQLASFDAAGLRRAAPTCVTVPSCAGDMLFEG